MLITDRIKTYEDALKATGRKDGRIRRFFRLLFIPKDLRTYFENHYKAVVITEALNEDWKPDWNNENEQKYIPWFWVSASGFSFNATYSYDSLPGAGDASRLCFKTRELAEYAGRQFTDIYQNIILK